ncbi:MAG: MtrB/PioB family decaheme-associated outer membrane protein [Gammaproteobacteria bacterium]|nr:MtrB/PioB family decaheme-associated outer membrane protein [Gammaproteobacteria bacterium]
MTKTCAALAVLAATTVSPLHGAVVEPNYDNVDTSRWRCRLCPFDLSTVRQGHWRVEALAVDDAHTRFGRDNGLDRAGVRGNGDASLAYGNAEGRHLAIDAVDLGLDSRQARFRTGYNGRYDVLVQWREVPRIVAADGRTPYSGDTMLELPETWGDREPQNATAASAQFPYATHRRQARARLSFEPAPAVRLRASYARETKTGTTETFADRFYQATGLPKPIDHASEEIRGQAVFTSQPWVVGAELRRSRFRNANAALVWENAFSPRGDPTGRIALAPDNDADTATLTSRTGFGRTRLSARLTWGRHRQDDAFLPYTTNGGLGLEALPAPSLGGHARTFAGAVSLASRLTRRLRLSLTHRQHERDNRSPVLMLSPVLGDLIVTPPRPSRSYGLRRQTTEARLRHRIGPRLSVALGGRSTEAERTRLEIARNRENGAWVDLLAHGPGGLALSLKASQASRDASPFRTVSRNNPLTRRYYQAARDQRAWRARVDYRVPASQVALGAEAEVRATDYPSSELGLTRERDDGWGVDVSYAPAADIYLSAFLESRASDATTAGSQSHPPIDWYYDTFDRTRATGFVARANGVLHPGLDVELTYSQVDGRGRYATAFADAVQAFPELVSDHRSLKVEATYRWRRQTQVAVRWYWEDYASADWAFRGVTPDAIRNVLTFGRRPPTYTNAFLGVSLERRM